ncbi:hypothetical protein Pr1d_35790 [Bythopirellula goksoeyrii]|uniref:Uncharacterized protein n=1 Tax=Bythopirellula goksoeyrii TaxID=1400387 RepID=A0A5B9QB56_9BACT|nr:hypothetical protein Pr1d_35790 [Bythopirellula goksoeyrii]
MEFGEITDLEGLGPLYNSPGESMNYTWRVLACDLNSLPGYAPILRIGQGVATVIIGHLCV